MANRSGSEKKLVNAVVDGEVGAQAIIEKVKSFGADLGQRLTKVSKALTQARVRGEITTAQAKERFREAYIALTLVGYVEVVQEVADHSSKVAGDIHGAAKEMGSGITAASPITKADFVAREIEKKNGA